VTARQATWLIGRAGDSKSDSNDTTPGLTATAAHGEVVTSRQAGRWEPKRLRLRLFPAAGRLARGGRRLRLRLAGHWPGEITAAVTRLQALPAG
jgi:hypothetical protein